MSITELKQSTRALINFETEQQIQFFNITERMRAFAFESGIKNGIITARTFHTTTAVCVNEDEPGLLMDLTHLLKTIVPENQYYCHDDVSIHPPHDETERKNGFAHLRAMLLGFEVTISITDGLLNLGKWQSILFVELDGPRKERKIEFLIVGN